MSEDTLFQKSLEYVLRAPKTERQFRTWLFKKRTEGEFLDVDAIVNRLKERGFINDAEYAQNYVQVKQTKIGSKVIQQKLMQKGVERNLVDTVVSEIEDQTELARKCAEKYMRNKTADQKTLQKLFHFLLNKGFKYDIISTVTGEFKETSHDWD